ncbi:hypothetical protein HGM15179_006213 [Zosterops borbonicus]|uniref:Uncharacterized protein n=1 Tax=Zosterops borbonicus TaxID=364589 RepID=A0A8K1GMG2_9PASS|nr:hypothetical protein HGM15179_006213 [Zosterops borbonicus]
MGITESGPAGQAKGQELINTVQKTFVKLYQTRRDLSEAAILSYQHSRELPPAENFGKRVARLAFETPDH